MSNADENILTAEVTVQDRRGLHLRLASEIVRTCTGFASEILVTAKDSAKTVSAKSTLGLMALAAPFGTRLTVAVKGADAPAAMQALKDAFAISR